MSWSEIVLLILVPVLLFMSSFVVFLCNRSAEERARSASIQQQLNEALENNARQQVRDASLCYRNACLHNAVIELLGGDINGEDD